MTYCNRFLAGLFGIVNLFAIIPISMISYVMGVRFCFDRLGIDLSVSLILGFIFMIVAVGLINGLAALFLSILDRLNEMRHDREAILEALHQIRDITHNQNIHQDADRNANRDANRPYSNISKNEASIAVTAEPKPVARAKPVATKKAKPKISTKTAARQTPNKRKTAKAATLGKAKARPKAKA
jgi:hypothetical protein